MTESKIIIAGRTIGPGHPPYVIAEMSGNHNGDLSRALALVEAANEAGADAVKLQTYTADTITIDHDGPGFQIESGLWQGYRLYDLYQRAHTPWEWHEALFTKGQEIGITVFSSPFDATAVDFLESLHAPAYKIASFEAVDLPLIEKVAATGKPVIISTGMADETEIREALAAAQKNSSGGVALMHCVSGYPTPAEEANLYTLTDIAQRFGTVTGLSDHTLGTTISIVSVALGANLIEKHFTLSRADGGPDAEFSLEPEELATLCQGCREVYAALGEVSYGSKPSEQHNTILRRSLYVVRDVTKGERLSEYNVRSIRPGFGMAPKHLSRVLGCRAACDLPRGTPLDWSMIESDG